MLCRLEISSQSSFSGSGGLNSNPAGTGNSEGAVGGEGRRDGVTKTLSSTRLIPSGGVEEGLVGSKLVRTVLAPQSGSGAIKIEVIFPVIAADTGSRALVRNN